MEKPLMSRELIVFGMEAESREEVIGQMAALMEQDSRLKDKAGYEQDVLVREGQASTAVGFFTATPHAKSSHVKCPSLTFARLKKPLKWDDQEEVELVFQVAVPLEGQGDRHLEILAGLFRKLIYDEFRDELLKADSREKVMELVGEL
ncbi:PTS sugar transporter subunit IIA [Lacrimispora indolis]|jgi:mannitol/fructose-specific phosphotransferase system IIA component (Ntr-type)|uniref:PTS sugar transporter subunit IIA n=1 Tax=Lacrimispora indolis TaxID=69825 RepID=UPI00041A24CB|nr:PTS sugar transporter subunit IIA [[Clostridium] methoxybenzovorans]MDR2025550.1 PTS sugar transporter subunit IIA [Hungatella sp.]